MQPVCETVLISQNMEEHVAQIINNCIPSNIAPVTQTILQHRELLSCPTQRIYLDTVGPLTSSRFQGKTCKHLLTILYGFTRYLTAIPIPDLEAKPLLKGFMEGFVLVHGVLEGVHTDNGSSLVGQLFQDSLNQMGIQTTRTPVYSPHRN